MDSELRSVIYRYSVVGIVLAGSVTWAVAYTTARTDEAARNNATAAQARAAAAPQTGADTESRRAPALSSLVVNRDGVERVACEPACRLEEYCDLRDLSSCLQSSCEGDLRKPASSDLAFARSETCAAAAAAPCEEACRKKGECAANHADDTRCTTACLGLVHENPARVFRESRCVLESRCSDLPLCLHIDR